MLAAVVMVACALGGVAGGVCLSLLVFRRTSLPIVWPAIAMGALAPFTFLGSVVLATLTGGLGEDFLGTTHGPPVGVFFGCLVGLFVFNSLAGGAGLLVWAIVCMALGQTDEEGRPRP